MRVEGASDDPDRLLGARNLGATARGVEIDLTKGLVDLRGGNALGLHSNWIQLDLDLAADSAGPANDGDALDAHQSAIERIVYEPAQLLDGHRGTLSREIADWLIGEVDALDLRLENAFRQIAANTSD